MNFSSFFSGKLKNGAEAEAENKKRDQKCLLPAIIFQHKQWKENYRTGKIAYSGLE